MKQETLKISAITLFVYAQPKAVAKSVNTDTTTVFTTTTTLTGILKK